MFCNYFCYTMNYFHVLMKWVKKSISVIANNTKMAKVSILEYGA